MKILDSIELSYALPAILLGTEVSSLSRLEAQQARLPFPSWWTALEHQVGGVSCQEAHLAGALLRLQGDGAPFAAGAREQVYRALEAMAAGATPGLHLANTHGDPYGRQEIACLAEAWYALLPDLQVRDAVEGWAVVDLTDAVRQHLLGWPLSLPQFAEEGAGELAGWRVEGHLELASFDLLETFGVLIGARQPMRAHLLWWSSD